MTASETRIVFELVQSDLANYGGVCRHSDVLTGAFSEQWLHVAGRKSLDKHDFLFSSNSNTTTSHWLPGHYVNKLLDEKKNGSQQVTTRYWETPD